MLTLYAFFKYALYTQTHTHTHTYIYIYIYIYIYTYMKHILKTLVIYSDSLRILYGLLL